MEAAVLIISIAGVLVLGALGVLLYALRKSVTWRRQVHEAERERDVANVMKNDFVAMVSHELRTPLTSIAGFAETLEDGWRDLDPGEVDTSSSTSSRSRPTTSATWSRTSS